MSEPKQIAMKAIDIVPYRYGIWCCIKDGEPFVNTIVGQDWSEDGESIWFMLDTHNFLNARPDEMVDVVAGPEPFHGAFEKKDAEHASFVASRPTTKATVIDGGARCSSV